jgi:hypothetical protein
MECGCCVATVAHKSQLLYRFLAPLRRHKGLPSIALNWARGRRSGYKADQCDCASGAAFV